VTADSAIAEKIIAEQSPCQIFKFGAVFAVPASESQQSFDLVIRSYFGTGVHRQSSLAFRDPEVLMRKIQAT